MRIYTIWFLVDNKKYKYRSSNLKMIKKIQKKFKVLRLASFDYNEL